MFIERSGRGLFNLNMTLPRHLQIGDEWSGRISAYFSTDWSFLNILEISRYFYDPFYYTSYFDYSMDIISRKLILLTSGRSESVFLNEKQTR
jgi:hypothetical protein